MAVRIGIAERRQPPFGHAADKPLFESSCKRTLGDLESSKIQYLDYGSLVAHSTQLRDINSDFRLYTLNRWGLL